MTRIPTIRDATAFIAMLLLVWLLAMAVLVYGGEGRGNGLDRGGDGVADSDRVREGLKRVLLPPGQADDGGGPPAPTGGSGSRC